MGTHGCSLSGPIPICRVSYHRVHSSAHPLSLYDVFGLPRSSPARCRLFWVYSCCHDIICSVLHQFLQYFSSFRRSSLRSFVASSFDAIVTHLSIDGLTIPNCVYVLGTQGLDIGISEEHEFES